MKLSATAWLVPAAVLWLAIAVFGVSLLTVARPPFNILWKLSIPVQEGGHIAAVLVAACAAAAWGFGHRTAGVLFAAAALLFATPLLRAIPAAAQLERDFDRVFPDATVDARDRPLAVRDLFLGIRVPAPVSPPRTLVYARRESGTTDGGHDSLALDFYPAVATGGGGRAPCVLVIHGGGWNSGDRTQLPALNAFLAAAGYAVAAIDYRLAPEHVFPAPVEDVARALAFLRERSDTLGIDPARIVLLGRSAGGQVALQAAYSLKASGIRGVIAFYAPADMVFGYAFPGNPLILDSRRVMDRYLGGRCSQNPALCRNSSPLLAADGQAPPTLLLHGRADVMVSFRHSVRLARRLAALNVPHFRVDLPWATHGYDYVFRGPGSQISLRFVLRFLAATTRVPHASPQAEAGL